MNKFIYQSSAELLQQLKSGQISSEQLAEIFYQRIEKYNPQIQAIVVDNKARALEQAKKRDRDLREGKEPGVLHGLPVTVKESFNVAGLPTTVNFKPLQSFVARTDSIYVERLQEAGAIILGKTNIPTLLGDNQSFGPLYPTANNPWDLNRTPGGSSGGSAAALAAGLSNLEIGSDIAGSIRNPANFCGIFGLKPTENVYAQSGHIPPMPGAKAGFANMACYGPMARSAEDIELAWSVLGAPDWKYRSQLPVQGKLQKKEKLSDYKIAWFDQLDPLRCSKTTVKVMKNVIEQLQAAKVQTSRISIDSKLMDEIFAIWGYFFGILSGQDAKWLTRQYLKRLYGKNDKGSQIKVSKYILKGLGVKFLDFTKFLRRRQELIAEFYQYFENFDLILCPVTSGPAFLHNHQRKAIEYEGESYHYFDYCFGYSILFNTLGNPAMSFPAGQDENGLPIGLQIAGPHHSESALIAVIKEIEKLGFAFKAPSGY